MLVTLQPLLRSLFWASAAAVGICLYLKFVVYTYWSRKGVSHDEPRMLAANAAPVLLGRLTIGETINLICRRRLLHGSLSVRGLENESIIAHENAWQ